MTSPAHPPLDETHDPSARSWFAAANAGGDFPLQNLPYAVFRDAGGDAPRVGVGLGDHVVDLARLGPLLEGPAGAGAIAARSSTLNALMALDEDALQRLRLALHRVFRDDADDATRASGTAALVPLSSVELVRPVAIAGYTDFFASVHHATNAGRIFRPDQPLLPNYKYVPVGYNGRAASVQVDRAVRRPCGQVRGPDMAAPEFRPSAKLDYEVELGVYVGRPSRRGAPIGVDDAWSHVFGVSLLNDWSARDIQAWEYQPLGPFLAKSFATSVSPWVVTAAALAPFRVPAWRRPAGDPAPLPHLLGDADQAAGGLSVHVEAFLRTAAMRAADRPDHRLSRANSADLYWTVGQMLAHHTSNGSWMETADLFGTGTISGDGADTLGSLLELTVNGSRPLALGDGDTRSGFLHDGDEVSLRGRCERDGFVPIGFGECRAVVLPAEETPR